MDEKVVVSVKMSPEMREAGHRLAKLERRTLSNWIESLIVSAIDTANGKNDVTLRQIMDRLDLMLHLQTTPTNKESKPRKDKWEKLYNMPLDTEDGEELMTRESWIDWIDHLKKMGCNPNEYSLKLNLEMFEEHYKDDWDINYIVADLIKRGARSIYIHSDLRKS